MKKITSYKFSFAEELELTKAALLRLCEITTEDLERTYGNGDQLDDLEELYLRSYLRELLNRVYEACCLKLVDCPATTRDRLYSQVKSIVKHYPDLADCLPVPSSQLKSDVARRLDSFKRRVADQFQREFQNLLDHHQVASPIEQLFLLEWKFCRIDEKYGVRIVPQATVASPVGKFSIDFLVESQSNPDRRIRIGIELDGHEFHEKTKQQVTRDKRRDRAIIYSGITVLRFSGSEIVYQTSKCIQEIIDFLELE